MSRLEAPLKTGVPTATAATRVSASQVGSGSRASAAAVAHSMTYAAVISGRGRSRSDSEPSSIPPITWGRKPMPKVIADSQAEPVAVKTRSDSATMRRVSAAIASVRLAKITLEDRTAKTSR